MKRLELTSTQSTTLLPLSCLLDTLVVLIYSHCCTVDCGIGTSDNRRGRRRERRGRRWMRRGGVREEGEGEWEVGKK